MVKALNFASEKNVHLNFAGTLIIPATQSKEKAFEEMFKTHYRRLHAYAFTMLRDEMSAEEMVQQVFLKLWENNDRYRIEGSQTGYLYRAVHNACLNHLKHLKVRDAYQAYAGNRQDYASAGEIMNEKDLQSALYKALGELPEQCRTIFQMSRFELLKYQEIAAHLGLSVKTVENQIGKALKILRIKLADYLPVSVIVYLLEHL